MINGRKSDPSPDSRRRRRPVTVRRSFAYWYISRQAAENGGRHLRFVDNTERFYRLDKARDGRRAGAGTGLGLPMVKAIAELHAATATLGDAAPGLIVSVAFPIRDI